MLCGSRTAIQLHACHATGNDLQDLDKKDALAEKKRETIMTDFNKTLSELGGLQDALAKSQLELERTHFELQAKQGACWQGGGSKWAAHEHAGTSNAWAFSSEQRTWLCLTAEQWRYSALSRKPSEVSAGSMDVPYSAGQQGS